MKLTRAKVLAIATLPGVVAHEWAHKKFCDSFGIEVYDVSYFNFQSLFTQLNSPLGYVVHAEPNRFSHTFWISTAPLIINSILAVAFGYVASRMGDCFFAQVTFYWIAISVGVQAFPSNQDARNVLQQSQMHIANNGSILHFLSYAFFGFICVANGLRRWWIDFLYAAFLSIIGSHL